MPTLRALIGVWMGGVSRLVVQLLVDFVQPLLCLKNSEHGPGCKRRGEAQQHVLPFRMLAPDRALRSRMQSRPVAKGELVICGSAHVALVWCLLCEHALCLRDAIHALAFLLIVWSAMMTMWIVFVTMHSLFTKQSCNSCPALALLSSDSCATNSGSWEMVQVS